jgi:hypothetical protein
MRNRVAQALLGARGGDDDGVFLGEYEPRNKRHDERCTEHWRPTLSPASVPARRKNVLHLSADIRACAYALTVAGAAQVALGATALAVPVSRLTRRARARRAPNWRVDYKVDCFCHKIMKYMQKLGLLLDVA